MPKLPTFMLAGVLAKSAIALDVTSSGESVIAPYIRHPLVVTVHFELVLANFREALSILLVT